MGKSSQKNELNWDKILSKKKIYEVEKKLSKIKSPVYPEFKNRYNAFKLTPINKVKVVILGQDPYHNYGEANGLAFSVNKGVKLPPSLRNIFKELKEDLGCEIPNHGDLSKWANQGVLLLNTALSVEENKPNSHQDIWKPFTLSVLKKLLKYNPVFILWGKKSQEFFYEAIKPRKNLNIDVLQSAHPSPFSANRGFFGCKHFSKCNEILIKKNLTPIDWDINNE